MGTDARKSGLDHERLFDNLCAPCLVLAADAPAFDVLGLNQACLGAGVASAAAVGRSVFELATDDGPITSADLPALRVLLAQVLASHAPARIAALGSRGPEQDPEQRSQCERAAAAYPIMLEGEPRQVLLVIERSMPLLHGATESDPATRLQELERQLDERTRELADTRAELEAFGYSVSHDLRAPLRAIDGFSQALAVDYADALEEQARQYIGRVRAGAERMAMLIDALLDLSRIGQAPLRRAQVDLSALARRILARLAASQPERHVETLVAPDLLASGDPHLVATLLEKLLDNAWKFTSKTAGARIEIGRSPSGEHGFFVADNGAGFDMAYATRLFAPFQRLHRAVDFEGVGIGLSIAQRIAARHGGRIWAESAPERGARFSFSLGAGGD